MCALYLNACVIFDNFLLAHCCRMLTLYLLIFQICLQGKANFVAPDLSFTWSVKFVIQVGECLHIYYMENSMMLKGA